MRSVFEAPGEVVYPPKSDGADPRARNFFPPVTLPVALTALMVVAVILSIARCYGGLYGLVIGTPDVFALLDPAWRILNGQRPYLDFSSQLGPFSYLVTSAGLVLSRHGAEGLVYGQVLFGFASAMWAFFLARPRLTSLPALVLSVYVLIVAISPFNAGDNFYILCPAMTYNRTGYALLAIFLAEALSPAPSRRVTDWIGGLSSGGVIAILLFTKITYFAGALFLLVGLSWCRKQSASRWIGVVSGFCTLTFAFLVYLRFDAMAVVRDFRLTAGARELSPTEMIYAAVEMLSGEGVALILITVLAVVVFRKDCAARKGWGVAAGSFTVLTAGSMLLFGNCQQRGLPLNSVMALFIASSLSQDFYSRLTFERSLRAVLILGALLLPAGQIVSGSIGIAYSAFKHRTSTFPPMRTATLSAIHTSEMQYAGQVEDGIALANQYRHSGDKIISLDFTNVFSYALAIPPARGGMACLNYGGTFGDRSHPDPARLFGNADVVMVPIVFSAARLDTGISRIYGPFLNGHFHLIGASANWRFYRRNTG